MADTSINVLLNRSEAQRNPLMTFKWVCTYMPFGYDPTYVETLDLPFPNLEKQEGWFGQGTFTYYPKWSNISDFGLTLYEDSTSSTLQWVHKWKNLIRDGNGAYTLPKIYKADMQFELLATDNSTVMQVKMLGVWPTDTGNVTLDYTQSERLKVTQTFSCDDQKITFPNNAFSGNFKSLSEYEQELENFTYTNISSEAFGGMTNSPVNMGALGNVLFGGSGSNFRLG